MSKRSSKARSGGVLNNTVVLEDNCNIVICKNGVIKIKKQYK